VLGGIRRHNTHVYNSPTRWTQF